MTRKEDCEGLAHGSTVVILTLVIVWCGKAVYQNFMLSEHYLFTLIEKDHLGYWSHLQSHLLLDSEDGFRTGCRNVSHKQQSFSGLQSPRWSFSTKVCYSWVQNHFLIIHLAVPFSSAWLWSCRCVYMSRLCTTSILILCSTRYHQWKQFWLVSAQVSLSLGISLIATKKVAPSRTSWGKTSFSLVVCWLN